MIISFFVGFLPDNGISNGLQGESLTNRNPYPSHHHGGSLALRSVGYMGPKGALNAIFLLLKYSYYSIVEELATAIGH
jgi:hypothetical protein